MRLVLPVPLPDEMFCSLLTRLCQLNGIDDFRDLANYCFGSPPYASFIGAQVNFLSFCRHTDSAYGQASDVVQALTCVTAQYCLGEISRATFAAIQSGHATLSLRQLTFHDTTALRYCPLCAEADLARFGMAYWHRLHQLPVVRCCPEHGESLCLMPLKLAELHQSFPSPREISLNRAETPAGRFQTTPFWRDLAKTVSRAFGTPVSSGEEIIDATLLAELRTRRLVTPEGVVRVKELQRQLTPLLWGDESAEKEHTTRIFLSRIARSVLKMERGVVLGRLLLIHWLFGTWESFEEKCNWMQVMGHCEILQKEKSVAEVIDSLRSYHRHACMQFMLDNPGCSRLMFLKSTYRSFRWLLHNDPAWLDNQLPFPLSQGEQLPLF